MNLKAEILIALDPTTAQVVERALAPEMEEPLPRARAAVARADTGLALTIEAEDPSGLRATINSLLRVTHAALAVQSIKQR